MSHASASRPSCVVLGSESLLIQCASLLLERGWEIARVVSRDDDIQGWAEGEGLKVAAPGAGLSDSLRGVEFDWLLSITNLSIIPDDVLAMPRRGAINFHDGPLPKYAGMYTPAWALLEGAAEYGITFHEMTGGIDEGRILVQRKFPVSEGETSLSLNTACYSAAIEAFAELADGIENDALVPRDQDLSERTYFPRHQRPQAAGVLDFTASADEVARLVRALDFGGRYENPFCAAKVVHGGAVVRVSGVSAAEAEGAAGTLVSIEDHGWTVACGEGAVLLSEFGCPRGTVWTPAKAAEALGLSVGTVIGAGFDRAAATALGEALTPHETYWANRLARLDPVETPFRKASLGEEGLPAAGAVERVALDAPSLADSADALVARFLLYLARIQGVHAFDVTWFEGELDGRATRSSGLYSAHVPLRVSIDTAGSAADAVDAIGGAVAKVREKGSFLVDAIARRPALAAHPLLGTGQWTSVAVGQDASPSDRALPAGTDLALVVSPDGARACLAYDPSALDAESVQKIVSQWTTLCAAAGEAGLAFAKLPLVGDEERRQILEGWNQTGVDFDRGASIRSLFEDRVALSPDDTAATFEGESLTYRELDERAGRLANHLADLGIGPDALVGLHLSRSLDMIVGAIGVLKAGGAYVPLDPVYPADRIAYMIEDSQATVVLTHEAAGPVPGDGDATIVDLDRDRATLGALSPTRPDTPCTAENLAYVIYTSGSTGKPKGVMVEHRNAVNFFVGMDEVVPHDPPGVWLAVTSLSFDISVLELLWTLTRGFEVVIFRDVERTGGDEAAARPWRPIDMGLALWGSDAGPGPKKYELMLESAKFADAHGFCAVHTPERHFGAFGGPFPNPSVTGAAIAAVTEHVQIRASSCVLPLHHPIRVAEEWAVVDNISGGRVGISFASGWQPNDFVIRPEAFKNAKTAMFENVEVVRKLWRGESVEFENPMGARVPTATLPRPVQGELPTWITTAGNVDTFKAAGTAGVNVLTHLLGQSLDELAVKVRAYRQARADAGHDPAAGTVTCMLHTFVGEDDSEVRKIVREPMKDYLASSMSLVVDFAWSFPAFERPGGPDQKPEDVDLKSLSEDETDAILEFAFERYYETSGLMGTPEACERMLEKCKDADIDEIACLIDFGVDTQVALDALPALDLVRQKVNERPAEAVDAAVVTTGAASRDHSFAAQVERRGVTHLQCTPSHATMLLTNPETRSALGRIPHLMIGGEAFPVSLAAELDAVCQGTVRNMYGPTETTIWSSTEPVLGRPESISIGRPIANTQLYILDKGLEPAPIGVAGELWIGGEGVVRGYHARPELTDERFVPDPFSDRPGARMYATGDLARWMEDGRIDFLGRLDHQVKLRGYRIELGEIEARLGAQQDVREGVVIAREDTPGDVRLVGYVRPAAGSPPGTVLDEAALREGLREHLPEFMVPSNIVTLDKFPQTPNGKVDRKALPAPRDVQQRSQAEYKAPENELEAQIAEIWKGVLYLEKVGVDDNFFDLGGHSLLVVQAHRKLRDVIPMPITLTDLYRFPTISGLASHLSSGDGARETAQASQARADKRRQALGRRRRRK